MHEAGIMQDALDLAFTQTQQAGGSRIHHLRLRIGSLTGVVPDALRFAFDALIPTTPADNATLEIELVPASYHCPQCNRDFPADAPTPCCPACNQPSTVLQTGLELELASMEIS